MQVLNTTTIASGYAGRDPQRGTSDGSFFASSLLSYKEWLKLREGFEKGDLLKIMKIVWLFLI